MTRQEAIEHITDTYEGLAGERCVSDKERQRERELCQQALRALGVQEEELPKEVGQGEQRLLCPKCKGTGRDRADIRVGICEACIGHGTIKAKHAHLFSESVTKE